jgi:hypothetical protein
MTDILIKQHRPGNRLKPAREALAFQGPVAPRPDITPGGPQLSATQAGRSVFGTLGQSWFANGEAEYRSRRGTERSYYLQLCEQLLALHGAARIAIAQAFLRGTAAEAQTAPDAYGLVPVLPGNRDVASLTTKQLRQIAAAGHQALIDSAKLGFELPTDMLEPVYASDLLRLNADLLNARPPPPELVTSADVWLRHSLNQGRALHVSNGLRDLERRAEGIVPAPQRKTIREIADRLFSLSLEDRIPANQLETITRRTEAALNQLVSRLNKLAAKLDSTAPLQRKRT